MKNGFLILGTIIGAWGGVLVCFLGPHGSDDLSNSLASAMFAFFGSIIGFGSVAIYLSYKHLIRGEKRFQYSLLTLLELMVVCAVIAILGRNFLDARTKFNERIQKWEQEIKALEDEIHNKSSNHNPKPR